MRASDVVFAFPAVLSAIMIGALVGSGPLAAVLAIAIFNVPVFARVSRSVALQVWTFDYVAAARSLGKHPLRITWEDVLPNIAGVLIVQVTIQLALAILTEAGLSYLGLGVRPPNPSWGRMLSDAQTYLAQAPHLAIAPGRRHRALGARPQPARRRPARCARSDPSRGIFDARRQRPGPLRAAQGLPGAAQAQHAEIVEALADDLQADRQALAGVARVHRSGGLLRHVEGDRVADVLEGPASGRRSARRARPRTPATGATGESTKSKGGRPQRPPGASTII